MPLYVYKCPKCGGGVEIIKRLADLDRVECCEHCSTSMERKLTAPAVIGDYAPYTCPITGKLIEGRRAHEENLKRHGCRVLEPGESRDATKAREAESEALLESIGETAAATVAALPARKQEQLANELAGGADLSVDRL